MPHTGTISGGRSILSYKVYRGTGPTSLKPYLTLDSITHKIEDTNLDSSSTYYYAVTSVNFFGESEWSPVVSGVPFDVPWAPEITNISAGDSTISMAWTEPEFDGGSKINQYRVEYRAADDSDWYSHITSKVSNQSIEFLRQNLVRDFLWNFQLGTCARHRIHRRECSEKR